MKVKKERRIINRQIDFILELQDSLGWNSQYTMKEARRVTDTDEVIVENMNIEDATVLIDYMVSEEAT